MRRALKISAVILVFLALYVGTFSYWWQRSPVKMTTAKSGRQVRTVEFQFSKISWHTEPLWIPAFWFVERFCGYERGAYAAMEEHSIQRFHRYAETSQ
jgi:hypothetical protein